VLAAETLGYDRRKTSHDQAIGVDQHPLLLNVAGLEIERGHICLRWKQNEGGAKGAAEVRGLYRPG
jgi:hypothetical protein